MINIMTFLSFNDGHQKVILKMYKVIKTVSTKMNKVLIYIMKWTF